jgi:hypothetical protein
MVVNPRMLTAELQREKLLIEKLDPRTALERQDNRHTLPTFNPPNTERVEPNRAKERTLIPEPIFAKSNTDMIEPNLAWERKLTLEPRSKKSSTLIFEPAVHFILTDTEEARANMSRTLTLLQV